MNRGGVMDIEFDEVRSVRRANAALGSVPYLETAGARCPSRYLGGTNDLKRTGGY